MFLNVEDALGMNENALLCVIVTYSEKGLCEVEHREPRFI